jgi:hypothetical protein
MCDHCRARILMRMPAAGTPDELFDFARNLRDEGGQGLLVSGGSDTQGRVPLKPFASAMRRIHDELQMKVIVHTGITNAILARELASAQVDAVLIDIIGDNATINEICHLDDVTTDDYADSLRFLCDAGLDVVPHVVIGLHQGTIVGELKALEMIIRHKIRALVLVGLRPLDDTPMAGLDPPTPTEMAQLFYQARKLFPETQVLLGCERPAGAHKEETDRLALEAGLDGIAFPADGIVARARAMGLAPRFSEMCCALLPENEDRSRKKCSYSGDTGTGGGGASSENGAL